MVQSEVNNQYEYSAKEVRDYREATGVSMWEAKKFFMQRYKLRKKAEMVKLVESGTLEDIQKIVKILIEDY
jgi:hypothetical protein